MAASLKLQNLTSVREALVRDAERDRVNAIFCPIDETGRFRLRVGESQRGEFLVYKCSLDRDKNELSAWNLVRRCVTEEIEQIDEIRRLYWLEAFDQIPRIEHRPISGNAALMFYIDR